MNLFAPVAALLLASTAFAAGCAEPVAGLEEQGATESRATSTDKDDRDFLGDMEAKAKRCEYPTDAEFDRVESLETSAFTLNAEVYAYVNCTVSAGGIVNASITTETRAGYSVSDGVYTERATAVRTGVDFDLKIGSIGAGVTHEETLRSTGSVQLRPGSSTSIGVSVERNIKIVSVSAEASYDLQSGTASLSAGAGVPLPIAFDASECKGDRSVGIRLSLSVTGNEADATALRAERVAQMLGQNRQAVIYAQATGTAVDFDTATPAELRRVCCGSERRNMIGARVRTCP